MQVLDGVSDFLQRDSSGLANTALDCPYCGRKHPVPFDTILIGNGVIKAVPNIAQNIMRGRPTKAVVLFDQGIEEVIEKFFFSKFRDLEFPVFPVGLGTPGNHLDAEVNQANNIADKIPKDADILIAAGSGVICDMTKWIATHLNIPFILCASAPSMNGYTSITAAMTENNLKTTYWLKTASAVVYDVDISEHAPMEMIWAGMGDLAARSVCNADWMLSHQIKGTYFCPIPYLMTEPFEKRTLSAAIGIGRAESQAIHTLSEAILMSGLSMTIVNGETSPSSGGEHIISHFWDFLSHTHGLPRNLHGIQVGVGTMMMLALYQILRQIDPGEIDPQRLLRRRLSLETIEAENAQLYGASANLMNGIVRKKYLPEHAYIDHVRSIIHQWKGIWKSIAPFLVSLDSIRGHLCEAGVPLTLSAISRSSDQAREALVNGWRFRPRYTALDLANELGLWPDLADEVLECSGV